MEREVILVLQILLADDEKLTRSALKSHIEKIFPSACIDMFEDGLPAWEAVQKKRYDLVITDLTMRQMDGNELALRIHEQYPDIEILFETGELARTMKEQGIQPERCIFKPFSVENIRETLEQLPKLPPFAIGLPDTDADDRSEDDLREGFWKHWFRKKN